MQLLCSSREKLYFAAWDRLFFNNIIVKNKVRTVKGFVLSEMYIIRKLIVHELPPKLLYESYLSVLVHSDPINGAESLFLLTRSIMSKTDLLYISVSIQYTRIISLLLRSHAFRPATSCFQCPLCYTLFNSSYQPLPYKF